MKSKLISFAFATGFTFLLLSILVVAGEADTIDFAIRKWAVSVNTPNIVAFWKLLSMFGSVVVFTSLTAISIGLLIFYENRPAATLLSIATVGSIVLDTSIKWLVHRQRPDEFYTNTLPASFSFPSGHALYSLIFYFTAAYILSKDFIPVWRRELWIIASILVILIGASRVFLGVHYVSDVLGGYLIGSTWLICVILLSGNTGERKR